MWKRLALRKDLADGEAMVCYVGPLEVALYRVDGKFYATNNLCPHQGGSLADGYLEGCVISCPLHGWLFDVRTGAPAEEFQAGSVRSYPVKLEGDEVMADLPEEEF